MNYIDNIPALRSAIMGFHIQYHAALAPLTAAALLEASGQPSVVDQVTRSVEALYAGLDAIADPVALDPAATLVGQLAAFSVTWWQNLSMADEPDRGQRILAAMRRRVGETTGPDPSENPLPRAELIPPAE